MAMTKLFMREQGKLVRYHEAWTTGDGVTEHWGALGTHGESREHPVAGDLSDEQRLECVLERARCDGYRELGEDDFEALLLIEYEIDGMGSQEDLAKRHSLQERMDETLGWTGLGHCDGGSSGSGTMEVCCVVVDFEVAERVVREDLAGTEFSDFRRIYGGEDG